MPQIPKFTEDKSQNYERALQYMVKTLQEENEKLHALLDEKQRVLNVFKIEYMIDPETQQICGRSKKILELQNKLEELQNKLQEAQDKLKNVEAYINRYTGLYFDEQATKELLDIITGQKGN